MDESGRRAHVLDWLWFLFWAIVSSAWCVATAAEIGATFDETTDLPKAMDFWRLGTHSRLIRVGAMPLPLDVATLPVFLCEEFHGTLVDYEGPNSSGPLFWSRVTLLAFWWLLLIYARLAGRLLAGPWAGRLAVAILACEPSMLAHASLATKDIAISATLLAFLYHFRIGRDLTWWRRVGVSGLWFGIALLAKASALAFGPICMVVLELELLARTGRLAVSPSSSWIAWLKNLWKELHPLRRDGVQIGLVGFAVMLLYCGCDWKTLPSFISWANRLPDGTTRDWMLWLANHLAIFNNGAEALVRQVAHNMRGHGVYILGQTDPRSLWYYFPVALSMKLTIPFLVLPVAIAIVKPKALTNWAFLAAGALLLYSLNCRVQIGVRLMLPLVTLAGVGLAAAAVDAIQSARSRWKARGMRIGLAAGLAWSAGACAIVWPHGLCYINEMWGGTANGYLRLSDSNYDWGQGLPELARWQREHQIKTLDVWYFGTDPQIAAFPARRVPLHLLPIQTWSELEPVVRGRHLAVSTTLLYGAYGNSKSRAAEILRTLPSHDRTQTFIIYDFTKIPTDTVARH